MGKMKSEIYRGRVIDVWKSTPDKYGVIDYLVNINDGTGWRNVPATNKSEAVFIARDIIDSQIRKQQKT
ncbi:MAG: hypothetical protein ACOCP8_09110 [archaeon]